MTEPAVEVRQVTKIFRLRSSRFGRETLLRAVDDVSFAIPSSGSVALVGESGSGKSTIARMIVGLEHPTSGEISVAGNKRSGRVSSAERKKRAREAQIVFQDPYSSLDPRQRVDDALASVLRLHFPDRSRQARDERVNELLDQVGLDGRQGRAYPRHLSGGQRQRVVIARALAAEPELLVLDEPVSSLDVSIQAQILNLLAEIRAGISISFLFVSHDLAVIRHVSDETLVMLRGRVVERGGTEQVLDNPQHEYTQLLVDSIPRPGWVPHRQAEFNSHARSTE